MDPLIEIADAIVLDLAAVNGGELGLAFDVQRSYLPAWEPEQKTQQENERAKVFAAPVASEGEDGSRAHHENRGTIQLVVGAITGENRAAADAIVSLAAAIALRYRQLDNRTIAYAGGAAVIVEIARPAVYDPEQLRSFGLTIGAINLTVRFDESI